MASSKLPVNFHLVFHCLFYYKLLQIYNNFHYRELLHNDLHHHESLHDNYYHELLQIKIEKE